MPPSHKPLEIDAGRIFRWSFLVIFLVFEWIFWAQIRQRPMRRPGRPMLIFLLAPWAIRRAALAALILAGAVTLVLTGRRIWFLPAAWGPEPWSMAREEFERAEAQPPAFARLLPVRHWPDRLRFTDRAGEHAWFAVADPDAVLAWFAPSRDGGTTSSRPRAVPEGVFDA
jgi:hypothetical protein